MKLFVPLLVLFTAAAASAQAVVDVAPGEDLQALVEAAPPGTHFRLLAGVHRNQQVRAKDGNHFRGEAGAVLSGARVLDDWVRVFPYWTHEAPPERGLLHGVCAGGTTGCRHPEDLWLDDQPLRQETRLEDLDETDEWYFEEEQGTIALLADPRGARVELAVTPSAFWGPARDVVIENLTIERYAAPAQHGAIQGADGFAWIVRNNRVHQNHGLGIRTGEAMQVLQNEIERNGQLGVGGLGDGLVIEANQIRDNNWAGFDWMWEAGGAKVVASDGVTFRGNVVEDNVGPGLWTDIDTIQVLYEQNVVSGNAYAGIMHEISDAATIRGNWVAENGLAFDDWLWGSQILISTSRNTEIYDNTVIIAAGGGNGITLVQQDRGAGSQGVYRTENVHVEDNEILHLGSAGLTGAAADHDPDGLFAAGNRFERNAYHGERVADGWHWAWQGRTLDWRGWRAAGHDRTGWAEGGGRGSAYCGFLGIEPLLLLALLRWARRARGSVRG